MQPEDEEERDRLHAQREAETKRAREIAFGLAHHEECSLDLLCVRCERDHWKREALDWQRQYKLTRDLYDTAQNRLNAILEDYPVPRNAPTSRIEVYTHPSCVFQYCPNPDVCKADDSGCIHKRP